MGGVERSRLESVNKGSILRLLYTLLFVYLFWYDVTNHVPAERLLSVFVGFCHFWCVCVQFEINENLGG